MVAVAIIGSAVVGAGASAYGASKSAKAQKKAAEQANDTAKDAQRTASAALAPYRKLGELGTNMMTQQIGDLSKPVVMDQAALAKTPGYQFNLTQGLKGVQNSAAARGLGSSGAALKGAAAYATGLADSTFQNQFNNAVTNSTNSYNRLMGLVNTGGQAATGTGQFATQTAANIGNNMIGAGNAQAGAYMAMGNAVAGAANAVPSAIMMNGMYSGGGGATYRGPSNGIYGTAGNY